jgi:threonine dehydrogenase-like Zn-dependent dehydrogenase
MGITLAHALGARVVAFTTSASKREDALKLGADEVVVSRDPKAMAVHANSFDFILDTLAVSHDLDSYDSAIMSRPTSPPAPFAARLSGLSPCVSRSGLAQALYQGCPPLSSAREKRARGRS